MCRTKVFYVSKVEWYYFKELITLQVQQLVPHVQINTLSCKLWKRNTTSCTSESN
jgi:hypothetical protein